MFAQDPLPAAVADAFAVSGNDLFALGSQLLLALALGHLLGWHFVRYGQVLGNKQKLARVLMFITVTTLLIITVVKSSFALSLGLVGALSIIRFRTPVKEPEELAYLFLAIAVGVGLGADRMLLTTVVFAVLLVAMTVRQRLPGGIPPLRTILEIEAPAAGQPSLEVVTPVLAARCEQVDLRRLDRTDDAFHASFAVELRDAANVQQLVDEVRKALPGASVSLVDATGIE